MKGGYVVRKIVEDDYYYFCRYQVMSFHSILMDYFADLSTEVLRLFFHSLEASNSITSSLHPLCESYSRPNKGKLLLNI